MRQAPKSKGSATLGKRDPLDLNTPNLLGLRIDPTPTSKTPFNLKELLGEHEENVDDEEAESQSGFKPLRFPSPSPSRLALTSLGMLDSPIMTWGDIETEPMKLGPVSQREAVDFRFISVPRKPKRETGT